MNPTPNHRLVFSRHRLSHALWAASGLFLATAIALAVVQPASAASDGSDWGESGVPDSSSAVTVAWNNSGNPAADVVPRDATQTLPHTGGKTYADAQAANPSLFQVTQQDFSGMRLTVSQTTDLVHEAVNLHLTGVIGGHGNTGGVGAHLDVFQCWSADTATTPDPENCETGAGAIDSTTLDGPGVAPLATGDAALLAGGNLKAPTTVTLTGSEIGTTAKLTATVLADIASTGGGNQATGATGSIEFDDSNDKAVATVPLTSSSHGAATATITGLSAGKSATFTAKYIANPTENYASSPDSRGLTVPNTWVIDGSYPTLPGATAIVSLPAGTVGAGDTVAYSLDGGTAQKAGTADSFGGLSFTYTVPSTVIDGATHKLTLTDTTTGTALRFPISFTQAADPSSVQNGAGTNSNPDKTNTMPFVAIDGSSGVNGVNASYTSTNEHADFEAAPTADGTATTNFEMLTGQQAPGLGCGKREDQPSTVTCWLVAVPMTNGNGNTPLSPSLWANRLQVKLSFNDVPQSCTGSQSRTLADGDEMLSNAMASWIPGLCAADDVALGYTSVSDNVARQNYGSDSQPLIFTTEPADDSVGGTKTATAPVALTGLTIAVRLFNADDGNDVTGVKLNARLVVKLLTESYADSVDTNQGSQTETHAPWLTSEIPNLAADPEFRKLNPNLAADAQGPADLVVDSTQSDAVDLLWKWILADTDAKSFLDGCPDADSNNSVINPFYSTRSYTECATDKPALSATANAEIAETATPDDYQNQPLGYPPSGAPFPQPGWYQRDPANAGTVDETSADSLANMHPQDVDLATDGQDVFHYTEHVLNAWCPISSNPSCTTGPGSPGKWEDSSIARVSNSLAAVTTASTAAEYQLDTAELCDDNGKCVGANAASLQEAAAGFDTKSNPNTPQPIAAPDIAGGAYPLTLPVYAQVNTDGLSTSDAGSIAKALDYITTTGQTPGYAPGQLPVGYAPLTTAERAAAATTVTALTALAKATPPAQSSEPSGSTPVAPNGGAAPQSPPGETAPNPAGTAPTAATVPASSTQTSAVAGTAVSNPQALAAFGKTPAIASGFPQFGVFTGLGGALAAGVAAPIVGRKRKGGRL